MSISFVAPTTSNGTTIFRRASRADLDRDELAVVVTALNRVLPDRLSDKDHSALLNFVEMWNRSGRAPWKEPFKSGVGARFAREKLNGAFHWIIMTVPGGGFWHKAISRDGLRDTVVLLAAMLLGNTLSLKLSDAPCQRCGKWFIARRAGQKCCAKRCAIAVNNTLRVKERRAAEHEERLDRARAALKAWRRIARRTHWKQFVSKQTELTPRFLQRAVTNGELRAPKISKEQDKKRRQK